MTRLEANREIVKLLEHFVEMYPDQRFVQLLFNTDILRSEPSGFARPNVMNEYNVESVETFDRVLDCSLWKRK